jgi:hypothetical protein
VVASAKLTCMIHETQMSITCNIVIQAAVLGVQGPEAFTIGDMVSDI